MIRSMTGFARREAHGDYGQLACELRSVNHRYLEPGFRLPEELRSIEHNPYWNVPPSIARAELVPDLRRSPHQFLGKQ